MSTSDQFSCRDIIKILIAVLGLISTLITIFVFSTGIVSIDDFVGRFLPTSVATTQEALSTIVPSPTKSPTIASTVLPTEPPTWTPIPTSTIPPQIFEFDNPGVSIEIRDLPSNSLSGEGLVRIQITAGGYPITYAQFRFPEATENFVGDWKSGWIGGTENAKADENGVMEVNLPPGTYSAEDMNSGREGYALKGNWGIPVYLYGSDSITIQAIIFPVYENKLTDITLSLAIIEVGVLRDGQAVDEIVHVDCQTVNFAGEKISDDNCRNGFSGPQSDGIARFVVGPGDYFVWTNLPDRYLYDIHVNPGEIVRVILEI